MKAIRNKKVLVIGIGKSGISSIRSLIPFAGSITAVDSNPALKIDSELENIKKGSKAKLEIILDENVNKNIYLLKDKDLLIVSPGVPGDIPLVKRADGEKIPVWSEIELGWFMMNARERSRTIAVTGTNGKTTTVTLIRKILSDSGLRAIVCGNIGNPLTNTLNTDDDYIPVRVIEVSSFQLERIYDFNPVIGIILNISSDHLDRHFTLDDYSDLKFRLFLNAGKDNWGIFNIDDKNISRRLAEKHRYLNSELNIIRFSLDHRSNAETYYHNGRIFYSFLNQKGNVDISNSSLPGKHNISNIMSAVSASKILGISDKDIERSIADFKTLEHRLEYISDISGVSVFNDSKSTNPDATIRALESFNTRITLILGGKDKGMDFSCILPYLDNRVENILLIGETTKKMLKVIDQYSRLKQKMPFKVFCCSALEEAVKKGLSVTKKGEVLLLSPACASFDMFDDYKDRGNNFKKIIMDIKNGKK
jgi:UDP-N-acetylmuramoylalanine--D-glutamate ligase